MKPDPVLRAERTIFVKETPEGLVKRPGRARYYLSDERISRRRHDKAKRALRGIR